MHIALDEETFDAFAGAPLQSEAGQPPTADAAADQVRRHSKAWRRWLQAALNAVGGASLKVTGKTGASTMDALAAFQRGRGLAATGLVSPATLQALASAGASAPPPWHFETVGYAPAVHVPHGGVKSGDSRCTGAGFPVPRIDDIVATNGVAGLPFEYVGSWHPKRAGSLLAFAAGDRELLRPQLFVAPVKTKLEGFARLLQQVGLPVEALLTAGSFVQRCITGTNSPSNHSSAQAFDLAGVRWAAPPMGWPAETIVHNYRDPTERQRLMRLGALLRLSFPNVLDFTFNKHHFDHFHVDVNGRFNPTSRPSIRWLREALRALTTQRYEHRDPKHISGKIDRELLALVRTWTGLAPPVSDGVVKQQVPATFFFVARHLAAGGH
jgi:hypothetical protein